MRSLSNLKPKVDKPLVELQKQKLDCANGDNIDDNAKEEQIEEINVKIAAHLVTEQRKHFEKELLSMKEIGKTKGKTALIFNLKEKVVGPKKAGQEATVLKDPKTNQDVNTPAGIKKVSIDYCQDLLTNRDPKPDYVEDLLLKTIMILLLLLNYLKNLGTC